MDTDTMMWLWGREEMVLQGAILYRVELYFGEHVARRNKLGCQQLT